MNKQEKYLYYKYRDYYIVNKNCLISLVVQYKNINISELYTNIINYQIDKYGTSLQFKQCYQRKYYKHGSRKPQYKDE